MSRVMAGVVSWCNVVMMESMTFKTVAMEL